MKQLALLLAPVAAAAWDGPVPPTGPTLTEVNSHVPRCVRMPRAPGCPRAAQGDEPAEDTQQSGPDAERPVGPFVRGATELRGVPLYGGTYELAANFIEGVPSTAYGGTRTVNLSMAVSRINNRVRLAPTDGAAFYPGPGTLPEQPPGYYREFAVSPTLEAGLTGGAGREAPEIAREFARYPQRLIVGQQGEMYLWVGEGDFYRVDAGAPD